jgi:hypothetical protein
MASVSRAFRGFGREVCTEALRLVQVSSMQIFTDTCMALPGLGGASVYKTVIQDGILLGSRRQNDK